ncbi:glycosyltransferase involved in cell wall biosynthesis [Fontibacillus phaseoli]|uniref:Glycosyltransferase involved in cell wall biosynthesis n=1 Tax=Fontibacillus phaseoli TaxID=1416533 RepID=A0A369BJ53_9BACL|nr:glycosyltransferase family 2 protein [Fontibacillus phaseoli]RCX20606.1 glycosyltransferase involved in cell wall biosynthesis [Fontibacillus phaseoli]
MKLLSVVVPCYNSQDYMRNCIESLLPGGESVEILIVNDGSSDNTGDIADEYAAKYPSMIKTIHQTNGGHGEAVNTGIRHASGLYFKVVDSDDWVDTPAYLKVLTALKRFATEGELIDLLISNFVYEKEGKKHKKVMKYGNVLPENKSFTWDEIGRFRKGQYLMMHSLMYRTALLRECGLVLPKHTFYVDNLYVTIPLPYVNRIFYLNVDFYRYFIGRSDQSINEKVMISRIDQQLKVNKLMIELIDLDSIRSSKLSQYLYHHLEIVTMISTILLLRSGSKENLQKKRAFWRFIMECDLELYRHLRYGMMGRLLSLPGLFGRSISVGVYKITQKVVGFN